MTGKSGTRPRRRVARRVLPCVGWDRGHSRVTVHCQGGVSRRHIYAPLSLPQPKRGTAEGQGPPEQSRPRSLCLRLQVKEPRHHCTIHDAWSGMRHVVQLRAQEEFGHGLWSEWSQAVLGTPWTGIVGVQRGASALLPDRLSVAREQVTSRRG